MKLIIHAGMPKAGSTALQERFKSKRKDLRKQGVLYPAQVLNHNFLAAGAMAPDELPRIFRQFYKHQEKALFRDFTTFWTDITCHIQRARPHTVIMSGESLWSLRARHIEQLRSLLEELTTNIEVVCYVRRPSDFYLSAVQQQLKASHVIAPIKQVRYRPSLEAFEMLGNRLHVLPYDRDTFLDGDICLDFAQRFLGDPALLAEEAANERSKNESMTVEAMAIVQQYRRHAHSERNSVFTKDTVNLMRRLGQTGLGSRPKLKPKIRRKLDQSSPDLLWLREHYGVVFDDIDYNNISAGPEVKPTSVADICPVDDGVKETMLNLVLKQILETHFTDEVKFRTVYKLRGEKGNDIVSEGVSSTPDFPR